MLGLGEHVRIAFSCRSRPALAESQSRARRRHSPGRLGYCFCGGMAGMRGMVGIIGFIGLMLRDED